MKQKIIDILVITMPIAFLIAVVFAIVLVPAPYNGLLILSVLAMLAWILIFTTLVS